MNSRITVATTTTDNELSAQLLRLGLRATASNLDDLIARATRQKLSPRQLIEALVQAESDDQALRNLQRRLALARIGRFRQMADFDWNWPKTLDREQIERALNLEFITEGRNLILVGANGLGKTMIAKNIAHAAAAAGHGVLFRVASDLLSDLECDSPGLRRRKLRFYARPQLLCIDEVGYLSYDSAAADLLYEVINSRYERNSILITTNRAFKDWNQIFPSAACITTMLDRLTHHAEIVKIEGQSYRLRESEAEANARRKKSAPSEDSK